VERKSLLFIRKKTFFAFLLSKDETKRRNNYSSI